MSTFFRYKAWLTHMKFIDTCPINEDSAEFKLCIDDILRKIKNMGPVVDHNEAIRCEFISTILHTAVNLLENLIILPQFTIVGTESTGRVDYAIKKLLHGLVQEIMCITEGKQNQPAKGMAQNLMQCRSSCNVSGLIFLHMFPVSCLTYRLFGHR
jgi:hypothetical protein